MTLRLGATYTAEVLCGPFQVDRKTQLEAGRLAKGNQIVSGGVTPISRIDRHLRLISRSSPDFTPGKTQGIAG